MKKCPVTIDLDQLCGRPATHKVYDRENEMSRSQTAAKVAQAKEKYPEKFCPERDCLWRTGGGRCPRHQHIADVRSGVAPIDEADIRIARLCRTHPTAF